MSLHWPPSNIGTSRYHASEAINAVFTAARRHPKCSYVVRDACYAFQALHDTHGGGAIDAVLRDGGVEVIARHGIADHGSAANADLIEEAVMVLCVLAGVGEALAVLADAGPGAVRTVGVKAIGELFRRQPRLLQEQAAHIVPAVRSMAAESIEDEALQQHAALVIGFCTSDLVV